MAMLHSTSQDCSQLYRGRSHETPPSKGLAGHVVLCRLPHCFVRHPRAGSRGARARLASTVVGVWKVISIETKEVVSGKAVRPLGDVGGTFMFARGGWFSGIVFSVNREAPAAADATEAERSRYSTPWWPTTESTRSTATSSS